LAGDATEAPHRPGGRATGEIGERPTRVIETTVSGTTRR
jgi:hypothetical protein